MSIASQVVEHLHEMLDEIAMAVEACPDGFWERAGCEDPLSRPAFLAHHAVWCMALPHLLAIDWSAIPANPVWPDRETGYAQQQPPAKQPILELIEQERTQVDGRYADMSDADYLATEERGSTPIDRVMYTLAHTRHHLGELAQLLKEQGIKPPKWYPRRW